jgi:hypothetical protein
MAGGLMRGIEFSLAFVLASAPALAGPWLPSAGDGQLITSTIATYSDDGFESIPNPAGLPRFTLCTHFEVGASDDITFVADGALQRFSPDDLNFGTSGYRLDKAMVGLRVPVARWDRTVLSFEGLFGTDAVYDNNPHEIFASTRGAAEARLMLGQSFKLLGLESFGAVEAGGRWRSGPPADEAVFDVTLGMAPTQRSLLLLQSFSTLSVDGADAPYSRYFLSKAQASAAYRLYGGVWLQAGGFASVAHSHTGAERGALVSFWWKF